MTAPAATPTKYTLRECARMARCSTEALRQRINRGELVAERSKVGGRYLVRADEVRRMGWLDAGDGPGHEVVTSQPYRDEAVRELRQRVATIQVELAAVGRVLADMGEG